MSARLRATAADTVAIVRRGGYASPSGDWVNIGADVSSAVAGTRLYGTAEDLPLSVEKCAPADATIAVTTESTLAASRRLGAGTAALVFASARNPGGGFLRGARAQEEDIARASALHACLTSMPQFYTYHRSHDDLRYSDRVIYSPDVPVFRDDDGSLLDAPYHTSFLTVAAPNLGAIVTRQPHLVETVPVVLASRAERLLRVAAAHRHRDIVLGAWGCGVFGNSPVIVASAFRSALTRVRRFDRVVFAILDPTGSGSTYRSFAEVFASG